MPKLQGWTQQGGAVALSPLTSGGQPAPIPPTTISQLLGPQFVNVKDFGALGNGTHDDTTSIQNAIWSLGANGGVVFLPTGTYAISAPLFFTQFSGGPQIPVMFVGANRQSTVLLQTVIGQDGIRPSNYCHIAHMTLRGPSSTPAGGIAIDGGSTSYVRVEDLVIENWPSICINSGGTSNYWTVTDIIARNSGDEAILITGNSNYWQVSNFTAYLLRYNAFDIAGVGHQFSNIDAYQCGGQGVASALDQDGFLITADVNTPTTADITLHNVRLYQNNTHGLRIQTGGNNLTIQRITVSGLVCAGNGVGDGTHNSTTCQGDGVIITSGNVSSGNTLEDVTVTNAISDGNSRYGFFLDAEGTSNIVRRLQLTAFVAVNHHGFTGTFGSTALVFYAAGTGTAMTALKIQGHCYANDHNMNWNQAQIPIEQIGMDLQTDDAGAATLANRPGQINGWEICSPGQNTEMRWHANQANVHDWSWLIDGSGNLFDLFDVTTSALRLQFIPGGDAAFYNNSWLNLHTTGGGNSGIQLLSSTTGAHNWYVYTDGTGSFYVYDATSGAARMNFLSNGNVEILNNLGIATATPNDKLEVNGNITIPNAAGGFYVYNVGDAANANYEAFRILSTGTVYLLQPTAVGTGQLRDVAIAGPTYAVYVKTSTGHVSINSNTALSSIFNVTGLSVFANNAAAIAGGLTAGGFYRTGADPDVVCVVH